MFIYSLHANPFSYLHATKDEVAAVTIFRLGTGQSTGVSVTNGRLLCRPVTEPSDLGATDFGCCSRVSGFGFRASSLGAVKFPLHFPGKRTCSIWIATQCFSLICIRVACMVQDRLWYKSNGILMNLRYRYTCYFMGVVLKQGVRGQLVEFVLYLVSLW